MRRGDGSGTAAERTLERLELMAAAWWLVGAASLLLLRSASSAFVLTLGAAVSIVGFRGLRALAERLGRAPGKTLERRSRRLLWLRLLLLLLVPLASPWLSSEHALALLAGFSVVPLAVLTEAVVQLFSAVGTLGAETDGDDG